MMAWAEGLFVALVCAAAAAAAADGGDAGLCELAASSVTATHTAQSAISLRPVWQLLQQCWHSS